MKNITKNKKYVLPTLIFVVIACIFYSILVSPLLITSYSSQEGWPKWLDSGSEDSVLQLETDSSNNVYLSGRSLAKIPKNGISRDADIFIIKYSERGKELWHKWLNAKYARFITDESDNIYTIIFSRDTPPSYGSVRKIRYLVKKFNNSGKELWRKELYTGKNTYSFLPSITASGDGGFYIYEEKPLTQEDNRTRSDDSLLTKYDKDGNEMWHKWLDFAVVDKLRTDSEENLYLSGSSSFLASRGSRYYTEKAFITKLDKDGNQLWHKWLESAEATNTIPIEIGKAGNIYLLVDPNQRFYDSYYPSMMGEMVGLIIIKYGKNGEKLWEKNIDAHSFIENYSLVLDNSNNLYVSGSTETNIFGEADKGGFDAFIVKYDKDGNEVWHHILASGNLCPLFSNHGNETAGNIAIDSNGSVYFSGYSDGPLFGKIGVSNRNIFIAKYE